MSSTYINDYRDVCDFKGITFSNFKKSDVIKELLNSFIHYKIESACYWAAELICSANYGDLWDTIIFFFSRYVHLGNPKLAIYLEIKIKCFKDIIHSSYNDLVLRNNHKVRGLFAEVICVLCDSKRKTRVHFGILLHHAGFRH